jgi:hypothetical protein
VGVLAVTGCNGQSLDSRWRDRDVLVDGDATEWYNATTYLKSQKVSLGVMNDDAHLYILLTSADRATQTQVLARGFTVWFDPKGGKHETLGIRFPLGMRERFGRPGDDEDRPSERRREDGDRDGGMGRNGMDRMGRDLPDMETLVADLDKGDPPLEILTEDEARRSTVAQETDFGLALGSVNGVLVYELRVPLGEGPEAVNAGPGDIIAVRLQAAPLERDDEARGPGPDRGFGDDGRGGPMGGPSAGGMPPPGMQEAPSSMPDPIDVWAKVTLAVRP